MFACFILSFVFYLILFLSFLDVCFSNEGEKESVDLGAWGNRKNLGRVRGGETVIKIYC